MILFLLIAGIFLFTNFIIQLSNPVSMEENYRIFLLDSLLTGSLILAGLVICSMLLYLIGVIVFKNPQKVLEHTVLKFSLGGIFVLMITGAITYYGGTFTFDVSMDMKDYSNGDWKENEFIVTDLEYIGRGDYTIETHGRDFLLPFLPIPIEEGETYRFTYLNRTSHVLKIEKIY